MIDLNEKDVQINEDFVKETIDLEELEKELVSEQFKMIEEVLKKAYKDTEILNSWVMSCIELLQDEQAEKVYLPYNLCVEKVKGTLTFKFRHKSNIILLIIFISAFAIAAMAATYWSLYYLNVVNLDKDIDGDGISDVNIDINKDLRAEINIDINKDNRPDLNIDYKGNRKAIFNIDKDNDRKPDFNLVTKITKNGTCSINCDLNNDGWPDINIDLDGDGIADVDIDTNNDNIPDLNLDTNGDGVCDLMCDINNDNICDKFCVNQNAASKKSGPTTVSGDPVTSFSTGELIVTYTSGETIASAVLPDDTKGAKKLPDKTFTVENTSAYELNYKLVWVISKNEFQTENLKYTLISEDGGVNVSKTTLPTSDTEIERHITIPGKSKQTYTIKFDFEGTYDEQNIDQNREFDGYISAEYDD